MAYTDAWGESTPLGTEDASTADNYLRDHRRDLGERLEDQFYGFNASSNAAPENDYGVKSLRMYDQGTTPSTPSTNYALIYVKIVSGVPELCFLDDDGSETQITSGGKILGTSIKNDTIDSQHYAAASIDNEHLADNAVDSAELAAGSVDQTHVSYNPVVQVVNTMDGTVDTGTTVMPLDDVAPPQITEGDEYMTLAIEPTSATNKLKIEVVVHMAHTVGDNYIAALFQDDTADALALGVTYQPVANGISQTNFIHYMTAGTTDETTFRVRAGCESGGTTTFNGSAGSQLGDGVLASSITITEIHV